MLSLTVVFPRPWRIEPDDLIPGAWNVIDRTGVTVANYCPREIAELLLAAADLGAVLPRLLKLLDTMRFFQPRFESERIELLSALRVLLEREVVA